MPLLRQVRIAMILLSISMTWLLLRNNLISLYQSSNFVLSPLNHSGSGTIFLGNSAYMLFSFTGAVNILFMYSVLSCEAFLVICKNSNHSDNTSISCSWCWSVLLSMDYATSFILFYLLTVKPSIIPVA